MNDFLASRIDYLRRLPNIGSGWIGAAEDVSGAAPSQEAAQTAIDLLTALSTNESLADVWKPGHLTLGPEIQGGVSVEMVVLPVVVCVSIFNTGTATMFITSEGDDHEMEGPASEVVAALMLKLKALAP